MKITTKLTLEYLKKNKKRSMTIILSITIVTILITSIIALLSSYQQYLVNSIRNKGNWEIKLKNIKYSDISKILDNENIKEISTIHKIGISEENLGKSFEIHLDVRAFDENALKNSNIKLTEGRLPENSNEIVISNADSIIVSKDGNTNTTVGENINITLNKNPKEFTVVGKIEKSDFDQASFSGKNQIGAITYLDTPIISNDIIIDISILTQNIQTVYRTGNALINALNINEQKTPEYISEEEMLYNILHGIENGIQTKTISPSLEYNDQLLNYECVIDGNSEFAKTLLTIGIFSIVILIFVSIIMIKDSFSLTYCNRLKEFGILTSIGMNKKQRKHMLKIETLILEVISICIGIILGIIFSYIGINIINSLIGQIAISQLITIDNSVTLYLKIPFILLLLIIIILLIIINVSSRFPMRKINKLSPIDAIKNNANIKIIEKQIRYPVLVEKLFKEEGILAYKNIRRDRAKYKTIVYSLVISLVLFLSINGLIANIDKMLKYNNYDDYTIEIAPLTNNNGIVDIEKVEQIIQYLKDNNLVDNCYASMQPFNSTTLELDKIEISDNIKTIIDDGIFSLSTNNNGNFEIQLNHCWLLGDAYYEILNKAGITELKDNEVIISNSITEKTKYGDKINLTNLKVGDTYTLDIGESIYKKEQYEEKVFTIVGIVDDFSPYINGEFNNGIKINQLINPKYALNLIKEYDYISYAEIHIKTDKKRTQKIDECMNDIKKMYGEDAMVVGNNYLPLDISKQNKMTSPEDTNKISTNKISAINEVKTLKILLYSFTGVVAIIAIINTFNTIYASIILRKKEFASLKSIGMSEKQLKRMTVLEGLFYGLDAMIFGLIISIIILYIMYMFFLETKIYLFNIPLINILVTVLVMYIIIFLAIAYARKEIKDKNIIDEIKNENI